MSLTPSQVAALVTSVARESGRARLRISGTSMVPLLRAGMVVDVEPLVATPRVGEILVFDTPTGLVAHRVVEGGRGTTGAGGAAYTTAGDAYPARVERVPVDRVVGRVAAVWSDATSAARRIDGPIFRALGLAYAKSRRRRAGLAGLRAFASTLVAAGSRLAPSFAFRALVEASREFEAGRHAGALAAIESVDRHAFVNITRVHHASGLVFAWLEAARRAGAAVPADLLETFRTIRWTNALKAGRVLACLGDVRDRFDAAGIPHVFLKGGARLGSGAAGADLHYSADVDVLVPAPVVDRALEALRSAGYREIFDLARRGHYETMHHRAPLVAPHVSVPVEVHVAIAPFVGRVLDYDAMHAFERVASGPVGDVRVFDDVGAAVNLAYHARELRVWRDVVLLSRLLASFDTGARARFDAFVAAERQDGVRLRSAVTAADRLASSRSTSRGAERRYLAWAVVREDLPYALRNEIVEAILAGTIVKRLRRDEARDASAWRRIWIKNALLMPTLLRVVLWRRSTNGARRSDAVAKRVDGASV